VAAVMGAEGTLSDAEFKAVEVFFGPGSSGLNRVLARLRGRSSLPDTHPLKGPRHGAVTRALAALLLAEAETRGIPSALSIEVAEEHVRTAVVSVLWGRRELIEGEGAGDDTGVGRALAVAPADDLDLTDAEWQSAFMHWCGGGTGHRRLVELLTAVEEAEEGRKAVEGNAGNGVKPS
jgi:hypothetical protein